MKSYIFSIISTALFVAGVSTLTVNTPADVISCAPLLITFTNGTAPYILRLVILIYLDIVSSILIHVSTFSVYPGATPDGTALAIFPNITGSPYNWTAVNYTSGTSLDLTLLDKTGTSAQSAPFTVQSGEQSSSTNATTG
ncbi:hypothetical protein F5888DRAFT_1805020 [Russula emetica]|nr:hypothetical protein F5888DRAFT_1805020 [Russula emetica]